MKTKECKKVWVDPPSGWRYGFPKIWNKEKDPDFKSWLIKEGYPVQEYDRYNGDYMRYWEAE